jgi:hypothetical protein
LLRNTKARRKAAGLASRRLRSAPAVDDRGSAKRALDAQTPPPSEDIVKTLLVSIATTFALVLASAAHAAPPSGAPAGTTGLCKDGSYYSGESKRGACRGHKGVKEWYGAASASSTESAPAPTESRKAPKKKREARVAEAPPAASTSAAPAGATGLCKDGSYYSGDRYYGATKTGEYMSESDAVAKGNRPAHGKACAS